MNLPLAGAGSSCPVAGILSTGYQFANSATQDIITYGGLPWIGVGNITSNNGVYTQVDELFIGGLSYSPLIMTFNFSALPIGAILQKIYVKARWTANAELELGCNFYDESINILYLDEWTLPSIPSIDHITEIFVGGSEWDYLRSNASAIIAMNTDFYTGGDGFGGGIDSISVNVEYL